MADMEERRTMSEADSEPRGCEELGQERSGVVGRGLPRLAGRLVCLVVGHTGQRHGEPLVFTCPRCRGEFLQPEDLRDVEVVAGEMIDEGREEDALRYIEREVGRRARKQRRLRELFQSARLRMLRHRH